jgi:hypothetical protein
VSCVTSCQPGTARPPAAREPVLFPAPSVSPLGCTPTPRVAHRRTPVQAVQPIYYTPIHASVVGEWTNVPGGRLSSSGGRREAANEDAVATAAASIAYTSRSVTYCAQLCDRQHSTDTTCPTVADDCRLPVAISRHANPQWCRAHIHTHHAELTKSPL